MQNRVVTVVGMLVVSVTFLGCSASAQPGEPPNGSSSPSTTQPSASSSPTTTPKPQSARSQLSQSERRQLDKQLRAAAWRNDVNRAAKLIERGASVNSKDQTQQNAFLIASSEGYTDLLRLTMNNGADITQLDSYNGTALIRAAERGHADIVEILLQAGIPVDHVNNLGWTALHESLVFAPRAGGANRGSRQEYVETTKLLVDAGANTRLRARDGRTPLQIAQQLGLQTQVRILL